MKHSLAILAALFFAAAQGFCADLPPEVAAARTRYQTAGGASSKTARDQYLQELQKLKNGPKAKKNRTLADAVDAEIKAVTTEAATHGPKGETLPYGKVVPGRPGFVTSPYEPYKGFIDVHGIPAGTQVICPYSMKPFLVPESK